MCEGPLIDGMRAVIGYTDSPSPEIDIPYNMKFKVKNITNSKRISVLHFVMHFKLTNFQRRAEDKI